MVLIKISFEPKMRLVGLWYAWNDGEDDNDDGRRDPKSQMGFFFFFFSKLKKKKIIMGFSGFLGSRRIAMELILMVELRKQNKEEQKQP